MLKFLGALALVVILLLVCAGLIKLFGRFAPFFQQKIGLPAEPPRLRLRASLALGSRARLYLVQCDAQEHLLLVGPEQCLVLDKAPAMTAQEKL